MCALNEAAFNQSCAPYSNLSCCFPKQPRAPTIILSHPNMCFPQTAEASPTPKTSHHRPSVCLDDGAAIRAPRDIQNLQGLAIARKISRWCHQFMGGFHRGTPMYGWFILWKIPSRSGWFLETSKWQNSSLKVWHLKVWRSKFHPSRCFVHKLPWHPLAD